MSRVTSVTKSVIPSGDRLLTAFYIHYDCPVLEDASTHIEILLDSDTEKVALLPEDVFSLINTERECWCAEAAVPA